ncbi:HD domain-containing phosphohydrolase [Aliidiomarina maris]|uniref:Response regulator RpfG family c-di-GMP phosphodiesterase n=1 Tax=Aliidiomarina maris TaxID=531312 RepID=A0A327WRV7_9GAMM|nr:HD domain-containing phosphohydrolase [Aliidiomarina maris]MBA3987530.1 two-component system response regulator [Idiomarina sp.]RAJ94640.1 response regulator RpfG family c-di-GMP phosphodiesterase [Aliidiomarina maris]RUO19737.1 two-component system response regulator [Aliidiomarina maris]
MDKKEQIHVLIVDDEPKVLAAMQRALKDEPILLETAENAAEALAIMEQQDIDVLVSDARMPGMDGTELLAEAHKRWPRCSRVLLTGYPDTEALLSSINYGHLYRFIQKPWNDDEVRSIVRHAGRYAQAERERLRLIKLIQARNKKLREMNQQLEFSVKKRTNALRKAIQLRDQAYQKLERSYLNTTEVFGALINQRLPKSRRTNAKVSTIVKAYAEESGWDTARINDLTLAAALYNLGKLTWSDEHLMMPSDSFRGKDRDKLRGYPEMGESLLLSLEPLQRASTIIRHHQERWDGRGYPDQLEGQAIPEESRLLKLAVDFVELQRGMVLDRMMNRADVLEYMGAFAERVYDPQMSARFIELIHDKSLDLEPLPDGVIRCRLNQLLAGMVVSRNLVTDIGFLLVNQGTVLTQTMIEKLMVFERTRGEQYEVYIDADSVRQIAPEEDAQKLLEGSESALDSSAESKPTLSEH